MITNKDSSTITIESPYGTYTGYENDRAIIQTQKFGAHTRPELSMVLNFIKENDNIIDVGAHIGTFAVPMATKSGKNGKLFAFEANPKTAGLLKKNIADNDIKAHIFNNGVSTKNGSLFIQERKNKYKSSGSDYLVDKLPQNTKNVIEVNLIKIDDVISDNIDFIKIDVEGMEIEVLQSACKTIDKCRPIIYSEYVEFYMKRAGTTPADFEGFFKNKNYHFFINAGNRNAANDEFKLVRVPGTQYIRGQIDFLLIPKESDRYPSEYTEWYKHNLPKFLYCRFRNLLKTIKAKILLKK